MSFSEPVPPCPYSAFAESGRRDDAHDFTDSYASDGHPELLYCRRCGYVILREPPRIVPSEELPDAV
jgi:hypothetical protein